MNDAGESVDALPVSAIQTSLRAIAKRVNYGIDSSQEEDAVPPVRINSCSSYTIVTAHMALGSLGRKFAAQRKS